MIWVRRVGAVVLAFAFAVVLLGVLVGQALTATIARPAFLADQLEKVEVYEFVIDDLLTAILEDARQLDADEFGSDLEENPLVASGLNTEQIAGAVRRALSPEDLEALLAPALEQAGAYVAGEQDQVTLSVDAEAHLEALVRELTDLMRESGAYERLIERELTPIFADWVDEGLAPPGEDSGWIVFLRGSSADEGGSLVRVFTRVVTPEWVAGQVEEAGDALIAYSVGGSDGLDLRIAPGVEEAQEAAEEIEAIIGEADVYDLAYATVIEPAAREQIDEVFELPYGIVLAREEILDALRGAVSDAWLEEQAAVVAKGVSEYATGQTEGFSLTFDLVPLKTDAWHTLTATAAGFLREGLRDIPACSTAAENAEARATASRELPACIPWDITSAEIAAIAVPIIATAIQESVLVHVPDTVGYTEQDLREGIEADGGPDALAAFDDVREVFTDGWTYTDADLHADLDDEDASELVEDLRLALSTGYVIDASDESPEGLAEALDAARDLASAGRGNWWIGALIAAVLVAAVAFLGGRSWRGRVAWAVVVVLVSGAVFAVVAGPVYQSSSEAVFDGIREETAPEPDSQFPNTSVALIDKLLDLVEAVGDEAMGSILRNSLIVVGLSAVALIVLLLWRPSPPSWWPGRT